MRVKVGDIVKFKHLNRNTRYYLPYSNVYGTPYDYELTFSEKYCYVTNIFPNENIDCVILPIDSLGFATSYETSPVFIDKVISSIPLDRRSVRMCLHDYIHDYSFSKKFRRKIDSLISDYERELQNEV